jgi:hypothetical protein
MAPGAYYILQGALITQQGHDSELKSAIAKDWKGKVLPVLQLGAIPRHFNYRAAFTACDGAAGLVHSHYDVADRQFNRS